MLADTAAKVEALSVEGAAPPQGMSSRQAAQLKPVLEHEYVFSRVRVGVGVGTGKGGGLLLSIARLNLIPT